MTNDDSLNISRRKILGSIGAVGVGAAGAGLGTTAYLSDTESFENNTIAAGHLDMKVAWEEHYYDGLRNLGDCSASVRLLGEGDEPGEGETGFPQRGPSVVAVADEDVGTFMECTTTDSVSTEHTDDPPTGVVDLSDVKPGDFGEITLCYSIYDNPGYVQLTSKELADNEAGQTEPERVVDASGGNPGEDAGELGEAIQAVVWYDPGGNNLDDDDATLLGPAPLNELIGQAATLDPVTAGGTEAWMADGDGDCHAPGVNCSETLYLTNTGGAGSGFEDRTKLYSVTLDDGANVAELSLLVDLGTLDAGANFTQVDAIAATPAGDAVYLIDKESAHLGRYDVAADTFTDEGAIDGIDGGDGIVLATFSPTGTLYAAGQSGVGHLYEIGDLSTPATANSVGISGVNVQGADIVYGSDGTLYLYSSADGKLYTVDPTSGASSLVGTAQSDKGSFTGLAIEQAGTGALVGSSESEDAIIVLDRDDGGAGTEYAMQLDGEPYAYGYGDMTVGAICPEYCIALAWWLPRDVGNEVQTDEYSFDLTLQTQQCSHNGDPFSMV